MFSQSLPYSEMWLHTHEPTVDFFYILHMQSFGFTVSEYSAYLYLSRWLPSDTPFDLLHHIMDFYMFAFVTF